MLYDNKANHREYSSKELAIWADEDFEAGIEESKERKDKKEKVNLEAKKITQLSTCNFRFKNNAGRQQSIDNGGDSASTG